MDKFSIFRTTVLSAIFVLVQPHEARAEGKFVPFKYGDFDTWVTRQIHESAVIGGKTKTLYEIQQGPLGQQSLRESWRLAVGHEQRHGKGYGRCEDQQLGLSRHSWFGLLRQDADPY